MALVDHERATRAISWGQAIDEALRLWVEERRVEQAVRRHREAYARFPVGADEFAPVLGPQRWPR